MNIIKVIIRHSLAVFGLAWMVTCVLSCGTSKYASTIVGGEYVPDKNVTEYFVIPYGDVSLPGKWEKGEYLSNSRQQIFHNEDSVIVAVAFGQTNKFEFNHNGQLKGYDFVKAYYDWDSDYFEKAGYECKIIESEKSLSYIVWNVAGDKVDSYFLFGEKNGYFSNFSISTKIFIGNNIIKGNSL